MNHRIVWACLMMIAAGSPAVAQTPPTDAPSVNEFWKTDPSAEAPVIVHPLPKSTADSAPILGHPASPTPSSFEVAARSRGTPDIPGLNMVWLVPWADLRLAREWRNIVVHQSEGASGSAFANAVAQRNRQNRKGVTIWVETDGTAYWSTAEWAVPNHLRDGNRNDNKYIDNSSTYQQIDNASSIGIEFVGNYPNVRKPPTDAQIAAWRVLVRVLQTRYDIPDERVFAHNWIEFKDRRYCEGCELARIARTPGVETAQQLEKTR
jgi:hypothetical protein